MSLSNRKRKQKEGSEKSKTETSFYETKPVEPTTKKPCKETTVAEEFVDKYDDCTFEEDKKVLKAFQLHAVGKTSSETLQCFSKLANTGE